MNTLFSPGSGSKAKGPGPLRSPFVVRFLLVSFAAGTLSACDIPTDAPQWEQRWIVPGDDTSVGVVELLPDGVTLTLDRGAFAVAVDPVSFQATLGSLCPACAPLNGQTVPKPAFQGTFSDAVTMGDEIASAQVRDGRVRVSARNRFGFDPIRPPGGGTGTVTLALIDEGAGGAVLDELTLDGTSTAFSPGTTLTRTLDYTGPATANLTMTVTVDSPSGGLQPGDWVPISLSDEIEVTVTTEVLEVTSAVVTVAGRTFDLIETDLDVGDVDQEMVDRVNSGAFDLRMANPWGIGATVTLTIDGPTVGAPVTKTVSVPPDASSTVRVDFTKAELQSFLGEPNVTMTGSGAVANDAGPTTLSPDQALTVDARFDLIILIG